MAKGKQVVFSVEQSSNYWGHHCERPHMKTSTGKVRDGRVVSTGKTKVFQPVKKTRHVTFTDDHGGRKVTWKYSKVNGKLADWTP